jgi:signal transduction histidine kinase
MGKAYFIEAEEKKDLLKLTERTRIARDLHDTLGHEMTGLIMHLELTKKQFENDSNEAMLMLDDGITTARASLRKIRGIVDTLRDLKDEDYDSLELLIDSFKTKTGVNVELNINKTLESRPCSKVIYRIVQEALTNSVRHGKASKVIISIINGSNEIMFEVEDDGVGVDIINLGNGLNGMKERINECHGEIHFESNQGFRIYGVIPKEEDNA